MHRFAAAGMKLRRFHGLLEVSFDFVREKITDVPASHLLQVLHLRICPGTTFVNTSRVLGETLLNFISDQWTADLCFS